MLIGKQARSKGTSLPCSVGCFVPRRSCYMSLAQHFWSSCLVTVFQIYPLFRWFLASTLATYVFVMPFSTFSHPVVLKYLQQSNKGVSFSKKTSSLRQIPVFIPAILICLIRATVSLSVILLKRNDWQLLVIVFLPDDV